MATQEQHDPERRILGSSLLDQDANKDLEKNGNKDEGHRNDCWGFKSSDRKRRQRSFLICGVCSLITLGVILLIIFLAIIPAVVKNLFNSADISILSATIGGPTNETFQASTVQSFSKKGPVTATVTLRDLGIYWEGKQLADLSDMNDFKVNGDPAVLNGTATVKDVQALTDFNTMLVKSKTFTWQMQGTADVKAIVKVKGISLNKDITDLKGCDNFPTAPILKSVVVVSGNAQTLTLDVPTQMNNPSSIAIDFMNDVLFSMVSNGITVGTGTLPKLYLQSGDFDVVARVQLTPTTPELRGLVNVLLSRYAVGQRTPVTMTQFRSNPTVSWLVPALNSITLNSTIPGGTDPLIKKVSVILGTSFNLEKLNSTVDMYNAFDVPVTITNLKSNVTANGKLMATIDQDVTINLPPKVVTTSPQMLATSHLGADAGPILQDLLGGTLKVSVTAVMELKVQDFPATITYSQDNVPIGVGQR